MAHWADGFPEGNPAVVLYWHVQTDHFREYMREHHNLDLPTGVDDESFRFFAEYCEKEAEDGDE